MWKCACDCGEEKIVLSGNLVNGVVRSCGCKTRDLRSSSLTRHGLSNTKTYRCWSSIIRRCTSPSNPDYKDYGGRGIKVCEHWLKFDNFLADMGQCPSKKHSIDRANNELGYFKENCRWALPKEQANNKRNNRIYE